MADPGKELQALADSLATIPVIGHKLRDALYAHAQVTLDNMRGLQQSITPTEQLKMLPTSDELIRTAPQGNWGVPTNSEIGAHKHGELLQQPQTKQAMDMATGFIGGVAYHGSPHVFDRFDISKIGTGEGSQAYGHGLYFAENPSVAKEYQRKLSSGLMPSAEDLQEYFKPGEIRPSYGGHDRIIAFDPDNYRVTAQSVKKDVAGNWIDDPQSPNPRVHGTMPSSREFERAIGRKPTSNLGALYSVDIPDEHVNKMLDWDKKISEHPPEVKTALQKAGIYDSQVDDANQITGKDLYEWLAAKLGKPRYSSIERQYVGDMIPSKPAASDFLNKLGIPGIKYLDAGSSGLPLPYTGDSTLLNIARMHFKGNVPYDEAVQSMAETMPSRRLFDLQHAADYAYGRNAQPTRNLVVFDPDKSISGLQKTDPNTIQGEIQP